MRNIEQEYDDHASTGEGPEGSGDRLNASWSGSDRAANG